MPSHPTKDETARIHLAVTAAEARAQAHIAFVVVPASDRYALYPVVWGALIAFVAAGIAAFVWRGLDIRDGFAMEAVLFCVVSLVLEWRPLKLLLVPARIRRAHARAFAHREFAARILASPERRGGVLLFVSLGERYAELIADREAHARVGQEAWDRIFADFTAKAQSGHVTDAAVAAIEACGAALAQRPAG
jgi:putative membrane protein